MILKNGLVLGPYWGKSIQASIGRDQLGIQSTSLATYSQLLPGLTNLTQRIRYYSFYAWLTESYATNEKNKSHLKFKQYVRRGEILFAFSSLLADYDQNGIPGSLFVKQYIKKNGWPEKNESLDIKEFADKSPDKKTYWQHSGGAFGQYYLGPLKAIGILAEADDGTIGVTDEGKKLSDAFVKSVSEESCSIMSEAIQKGQITFSLLRKISKKVNCHTISSGSKETGVLIDLLFKTNNDIYSRFRYEGLILLLEYIRREGYIEQSREFSLAVYYNKTSNNKNIPFSDYCETLKAWKYYEINEYTHYSLESIFEYLLQLLHKDGSWISVNECVSQFTKDVLKDINTILPAISGIQRKTPVNDIIKSLAEYNTAQWHKTGSPEWLSDHYKEKGTVASPVLNLLSLLSRHYGDLEQLYVFSKSIQIYRQGSFIDIFQNISRYLDASLEQFLNVLLCQEVIGRHLKVAYQKLNYTNINTLKFVYEHDSLLWLNKSEPTWTSPRLGSLFNFLKDLKMINTEGALTEFGESVYAIKAGH